MEVETISAVRPEDTTRHGAGEINLLDLLIILGRRKKFISQVTAAGALLALGVSFLLPNRYTATGKILPPQQNQSLAAALMGQLASVSPMAAMAQSNLGLKNPNDIYVGMLKSEAVQNALIRRFDLMEVYRDKRMSDARKDLQKASEIDLSKEGFITIAVEDKNPKRAADVANAYVEELRKMTQDLAVTEAGQRRLFYEGQLELAKEKLASAEADLRRTQESTGLVQLDGQAKAMLETVATLKGQIITSEAERESLRQIYGWDNSRIHAANAKVEQLKAELAKLESRSTDYRVSSDGDLLSSAGKIPQAGLEYVRKLREVKYHETIFEILAKQYEAARLDEAKNAAVIQIIDPAAEPDKSSSPKRLLIIAIAADAGFVLSALWALFSEKMRAARKDPAQREQLDALAKAFTGARGEFWCERDK